MVIDNICKINLYVKTWITSNNMPDIILSALPAYQMHCVTVTVTAVAV